MSNFSFIKVFIETSFIDWDGQIVSVIFTSGCNFACPYCQNASLVVEPEKVKTIPWEKIKQFLQVKKDWLDGVCLTGGEPTIQKDLPELLQSIKELGLKTKLDTNGGLPPVLDEIISKNLVDYVAMDLKAPLDERYFKAAGREIDLNNIKKSLEILKNSKIPFELRITCVPGLTGKDELVAMIPEIKGSAKFALQNFKPKQVLSREFRKIKPHTAEELEKLADLLRPHVEKVVVRI